MSNEDKMIIQDAETEQIGDIIAKGSYKEAGSKNNTNLLWGIVSWIEQEPLSAAKLQQIAELVSFYSVPFLFELRDLYEKLTPSDRTTYERELQKIMMIAKDLLKNDIPKELDFLLKVDGVKDKLTIIPHKRTPEEEKFLAYWTKVRRCVDRILQIPLSRQAEFQKAVNQFFESELVDDPSYSLIENRTIDYYIQQIYQMYQKFEESKNSQTEEDQSNSRRSQQPTRKQEVVPPAYVAVPSYPNANHPSISYPHQPNYIPVHAKSAPKEDIYSEEDGNHRQFQHPIATYGPSRNFKQGSYAEGGYGRPYAYPKERQQYHDRNQFVEEVKQAPKLKLQKSEDIEENRPICCRRFFYKDDVLDQGESLTLQFKDYNYPWPPALQMTLRKLFCGFLNKNGGILLIGIAENTQTKEPVVNGNRLYSEAVKEKVFMTFTDIVRKIYPDIISSNKYHIEFVPVKNRSNKQFIPGAYVIRVKVECGDRDSIYFYTQDDVDYYYFRTYKQVLRMKTSDVFEELKRRIRNPPEKPVRLHEGACLEPMLGKPIYDNHKKPGRDFDLRDQRTANIRYPMQLQPTKQEKAEQKPLTTKQTVTRIVINFPPNPSPHKNHPYVERVSTGIKNIHTTCIKELPEMVLFKLRAEELSKFNHNVNNLRQQLGDSCKITVIEPYATFFISNDPRFQSARDGSEILKKTCSDVKFEFVANGNQGGLFNFTKIQSSIKAFFALAIHGFRPRFKNPQLKK